MAPTPFFGKQNSGKWVQNPKTGRYYREYVPTKKPLGHGYVAGLNKGPGYRIEGKLWTNISKKNNIFLSGMLCGSFNGNGIKVSILPNRLKKKPSEHDYKLILNYGGAEYLDGMLAKLWLRKYKDRDETYLIGRFGDYTILIITKNHHATEANGEPSFYIKLKPLELINLDKSKRRYNETYEERLAVEKEMFRSVKFEVPYDHVCKYGA